MARKKASLDSVLEDSEDNGSVIEKKTTRIYKTKWSTTRIRKKSTAESTEEKDDSLVSKAAGSVALALARLCGKVAFMGKPGDADYGQAMLSYMNVNNVQTRSVRLDIKV